MPPKFTGYASHNWGEGNHERVGLLVDALAKQHSLQVFFEKDKASASQQDKISKALAASGTLIVFITAAYLTKVAAGASKEHKDFRHFEFTHGGEGGKPVIAVVMEPDLVDASKWTGPVAEAGLDTVIDFSLPDKLDQAAAQLASAIAAKKE